MRLYEYMENFPRGKYDALMANDIMQRVGKLLAVMSDISAGQYILECLMSHPGVGGDFSIQITPSELPELLRAFDGDIFRSWCEQTTAWSRTRELCRRWATDPLFTDIGDIWLEFDYEAFDGEIPLPCLFVGTEKMSIEDALRGSVSVMLGDALSEGVCKCLRDCSYALSNVGIFQLGVMLGRDEARHSVRLFTNDLDISQIMPILRELKWGSGEAHAKLEAFIEWTQEYSDGLYILDLEVSPAGLSDKIGICFSPPLCMRPVADFLEALEKKGLAIPEKCVDVKKWITQVDILHLVNNISHFKITFEREALGAKVYLRNEPYKNVLLNPNIRW